MNELTQLYEKNKRLQDTLLTSIEFFNNGEDRKGLDMLMNAMEDLENILDNNLYVKKLKINFIKIISAIEDVNRNIKNEDIVGLTDVLENTFYPLTKEWLEEDNDI